MLASALEDVIYPMSALKNVLTIRRKCSIFKEERWQQA
jgi:hypothetical protein